MQAITPMKRVVIIGQAPPRIPAEIPYGRTRLYAWLAKAGVEKNEALQFFAFTALVNMFPGTAGRSHKAPDERLIASSRPKLLAFLRNLRPDIIVPVGVLAIRQCLCNADISLADAVGQLFVQDPFGPGSLGYNIPIIPLPHPSGASPWIHQGTNGKQLDRALQLLAEQLNTLEPNTNHPAAEKSRGGSVAGAD